MSKFLRLTVALLEPPRQRGMSVIEVGAFALPLPCDFSNLNGRYVLYSKKRKFRIFHYSAISRYS